MLNQKIEIVEDLDTLTIRANGTKFVFDKDEPMKKLVDVFNEIGITDVTYELVY